MKKTITILLFLFTLSCSINKVSNTHGFRFVETKYDKILINQTNKNDLRKIIGPPSSESKFGDVWFYIERKKTNQSIVKLGKKKLENNNILILEFNEYGIVKDKNLLNLQDMNDIKIADKKTFKKFKQDNFVYNILSTLREKINAPTRKKR
jgi:outer membrane protein assembly factor BamE (lipoprotein component of BamABCDE complex)